MATPKAEDTRRRILDAALDLFREQSFESATMRDIAAKAEVATGAAYYYYPSKDAIVMAFYERASEAMAPELESALQRAAGLEQRLREAIRVKLDYFAPNRRVLRALLRNGADPRHPLSPFSAETHTIRDADIACFRKVLEGGGTRVPKDLAPHMPDVLWMLQMGIIFFWVTDDSTGQRRTRRLLDVGCKIVVGLLRVSGLPLMRPVRKVAIELIEIVKGDAG
jgi:AcrR family transcriptional regulator